MSRTAGSGEPNDSANFSIKGAAIFLVGGNVSECCAKSGFKSPDSLTPSVTHPVTFKNQD